MAYSIEPTRTSRLPPDRWVRWIPAPLQMLLALGLAVGALYLAEIYWTDIAGTARSLLYTVVHESGHALPEALTKDGEVTEMVFNLDGSGYVRSTGGSDTTLRVGLGLLLPVIVASLLMSLGLMRLGLASALGFIFIALFWLAVFFGREHDMRVFWTICYWAVPALIVACLPWPLLRSTTVLVYALALSWGAIEALPYLHVEYVDSPMALSAVNETSSQAPSTLTGQTVEEEQIPSDIRQLADYWNAADIAEARHYVLALMIACATMAVAWVLSFILRHCS